MSFTEQDVKDLDEFGKLISEKAVWKDISTADVIRIYRSLQFVNSMRKKITDNILEYRAIHQAVDPIVGNTGTSE